MMSSTVRASELLKTHRESIDRLDAILLNTLGERFSHTRAVGKLKAENDLPASDPSREAEQMFRLETISKSSGLDPTFAKKILAFIIDEVVTQHKSINRNQ
jgi:chorismate mutase